MTWRTLLLACCLMTAAQLSAQSGDPRTKNELLDEAEAIFRKGNVDASFKKLEEAVKKTPSLPPAKLLLAKLHLSAKNGPAARTALEQASSENPEHPEVFLVNAAVALSEGRVAETILNCRAALTHASAERWTGEQKKFFQKEARIGLANAFELRQDWASAREELAKLLELDSSAQTRIRLARALSSLGRPQEAFFELQKAYSDDPTVDPPELSLARFASQREDAPASEEWFTKAVAKYPKNAKVFQAYGGWLLDSGKTEAAKVQIDAGAAIDPKSRETQGLKGLLARYQRDFPAAEKFFDGLYQDNPGDFFSSNQLVLVLIESTDEKSRKKAVQLAEVNARQYSRSAEALATLGWVYLRVGRLEEADQVLGAVGNTGQVSADTAYYIAKLLSARGKIEEARQLLTKAIESKGVFVNRQDANQFATELKVKK